MRMSTLSILLAGAALFTAAANAQTAPAASQGSTLPPTPFTTNASSPQNPGVNSWQDRFYEVPASRNIEVGFRALDNRNFARAEEVFADVVARSPRNAAANFYLGATRMDLGKWEAAKKNLEFAAKKMPRHPDPQSRLGVTYAKLGDTAAAATQRAALVKMANACNNVCKLSPYIEEGIQMIDAALAEAPARG